MGSNSSKNPPLPPTKEDQRISWLRLLRSRRVGIATFYRLMGEYGSAEDALDALPEIARSYGEKHYRVFPHDQACAELAAGHKLGAKLLLVGDPDYPKQLTHLDDAPPILWALGQLGLAQRRGIAIIGARNASSLGLRTARFLSGTLAEQGFAIISGLARGIDAAAHDAALDHATIAVVANGLDEAYPPENAELSQKIAEKGVIFTEYPPGTKPQARHFPVRNRIVSGLAEAVVVVEAAAKSGSLLTARAALDQGREVLAVPGHPFDARAAGCNMLIRDGATLVRSADDVINALPPLCAPMSARATSTEPAIAPSKTPSSPKDTIQSPQDSAAPDAITAEAVLAHLSPSPISEDALIRDFKCGAQFVIPVLVRLELSGKIKRHSGGLISAIPAS